MYLEYKKSSKKYICDKKANLSVDTIGPDCWETPFYSSSRGIFACKKKMYNYNTQRYITRNLLATHPTRINKDGSFWHVLQAVYDRKNKTEIIIVKKKKKQLEVNDGILKEEKIAIMMRQKHTYTKVQVSIEFFNWPYDDTDEEMSSRFDSAPAEASALLTALFSFIRSAHFPEKRIPRFVRRIRDWPRLLANRQIRFITVISLEFNGLRYKHTLIFHWLHDNVIEHRIDLFSFAPSSLFNSFATSFWDNVKCAAVLPELRLHSVLSSSPRFHIESSRHWRNTHSKITLGTFAITK